MIFSGAGRRVEDDGGGETSELGVTKDLTFTLFICLFVCLFVCVFFLTQLLSSPFCFALPLGCNSDPGSQSRPFSPHLHYGSCLESSSRKDFSCFSPRRLASNCACLGVLSRSVCFCKYIPISPQQDSSSRKNTWSIRGLPLDR